MGAKTKTKEKIIITARELFTEYGIHEISTNTIAETCGISPGNLYYYFRHKEQIILELLNQMLIAEGVVGEGLKLTSLSTYREYFSQLYPIYIDYNFLRRDFPYFITADKGLKEWILSYKHQKRMHISNTLSWFIREKIIRTLTQEEADSLVEQITFISFYWLPYAMMEDDFSIVDSVEKGGDFLIKLLSPYSLNS